MSNGKKHGCMWWLFIGWWWWLCPIKWLLVYLQRRPQTPHQPTPPQPTPLQAPTQKAPEAVPSAPQPKVERHMVAGTSFRLDEINVLGLHNDDYDKSKRTLIEEGLVGERIWQTEYFTHQTTLEPEPDNPEDPKAIKVLVDGVHIGYIKSGSCAHIHKVMRDGRLESVRCEIKGGKYKVILDDFDEDGDSVYTLECDEALLHAVVYITLN